MGLVREKKEGGNSRNSHPLILALVAGPDLFVLLALSSGAFSDPSRVLFQLRGFRTPPLSGEPPFFRLTHTLTKQNQQKNTQPRDPFYSELWRFRLRGGDSSPSPSQLYSLEEQPEKPPPAQTGINETLVPSRNQLSEPWEPPWRSALQHQRLRAQPGLSSSWARAVRERFQHHGQHPARGPPACGALRQL